MTIRNIIDYTQRYRELPFEPIQLSYRRKCVLKEIAKACPKSLLEVGCGELPLFLDINHLVDVRHTVVEPSVEFSQNASFLADGRNDIRIVQGFIEDFDAHDEAFDMVVASCVLHEVGNPQVFLSSLRRLCTPSTTVHINVPNARSLHRLLAVAMGLISHEAMQSDTQQMMQQRSTVYNTITLRAELERAGFLVIDSGSIFVKPFTHAQMQKLVEIGFMTSEMLDGFDRLVEYLPDLGSEIWVNARCSP